MEELQQVCLCELRRERNLNVSVIERGDSQETIFSGGWTALVGVILEQIEDIQELIHPEDRDDFTLHWQKSAKSHQQFDFRLRNLKGEYRWFLADIVPIQDDTLKGVSATFIDITARKISELDFRDRYLENLERFMSHWHQNPKEMCYFVGRAIARIAYRNLSDLNFGISTAYFAFREICERIDYIYGNFQKHVGGECGQLLKELVEIEERAGIICLKDIRGNHYGIRVMLVRYTVDGYLTYSLRYFLATTERATGYLKEYWAERTGKPTFNKVLNTLPPDSPQLYEDEHDFWNFRQPEETIQGVIVYPDAQGFYDLQESKSVADFIVLTSNLLGFGKCISDHPPIIP